LADPGPLVAVEDPADPRLADYRDLVDPASRRRVEAERSIMVVEGRLAVAQLLGTDHPVRSLLVDHHRAETAADLVDGVRGRGAPVYVGSREVVEATVGFRIHRGVVAVAERPRPADPAALLAAAARTPVAGGAPVVAVLEGLNDHENIGALFRNAAAFGVGAVLLDPTCADPLYRRSIRVSVGHVLHVPFARLAPWPGGLDLVRSAGFAVCALSPRPAGTGRAVRTLAELAAHPRAPSAGVALLLGAEGPGLSPEALAAADEAVSIPMADGVDSLNVATAAAVAFERLAHPCRACLR
jgi:tRNA G18 (ribose-2'-O)-methylase SpoU